MIMLLRMDGSDPIHAHHAASRSGLRERKKRATSNALQVAALRLVDRHGIDEVTIDDIVAAADVSRRTFSNYFTSKEQALVGMSAHESERFALAFRARPAHESPLEAIRATFASDAHELETRTDLLRLRLEIVARHPALYSHMVGSFAEWERGLAQAVADRVGGTADVDLYPSLVASTVAGLMRASVLRWRATGFTTPLGDIFDEALELVASGLEEPS